MFLFEFHTLKCWMKKKLFFQKISIEIRMLQNEIESQLHTYTMMCFFKLNNCIVSASFGVENLFILLKLTWYKISLPLLWFSKYNVLDYVLISNIVHTSPQSYIVNIFSDAQLTSPQVKILAPQLFCWKWSRFCVYLLLYNDSLLNEELRKHLFCVIKLNDIWFYNNHVCLVRYFFE